MFRDDTPRVGKGLERARRKSSTVRRGRRSPRATPSPAFGEAAVALISACSAAAAGFDVCARKTQDETIVVAARNAAAFLRGLIETMRARAADFGIEVHAHPRTRDRLRWEWLASTASVVDGTPDGRLLVECSRILSEMRPSLAAAEHALGEGLTARLRIASAEAYSLASALRTQGRDRGQFELAFGLT